jgi:hypothetical protein
MNTDYKIYARIIANRIKQTSHHVLHDAQYSATGARNILLDAATALRDVIAAGSTRRGGMCLVTLDFQSAFNNISHEYMYAVLRRYKYGTRITVAITSLYEHATS